MNFVSSHHWEDYTDLIEGEPDFSEEERAKTVAWLKALPPHPDCDDSEIRVVKELQALCLLCYAAHSVGRYRFINDPIELEDGSTTTFEDWRAESERNRIGRSRRRRFHCPRCDLLTDHVAEA